MYIVYDNMMTYRVEKIEARFVENMENGAENGFYVGNELTIADIKLDYAISFVCDLDHINETKLLKPCPEIRCWRNWMLEDMERKMQMKKPKYYLFSMAKPMK